MITDNAAPFNEGQSITGHAGMHHRAALGDRGGIPPYLYTAQTGEDYIDAHINHVIIRARRCTPYLHINLRILTHRKIPNNHQSAR